MNDDTTADTGADMDGFDEGGEDAFLKNLVPGSEGTTEAPVETPEETPQETDEAPEEAPEGDDKASPAKSTAVTLADDTKITVRVGDEDREVTLADLKALASKETSLTAKEAEVEALRATQETVKARAETALKSMLDRAKARLEPYEKLDYLRLSNTMDEGSWNQLRADALAADADVKFLQAELDGTMQAAQQAAQQDMQRAAQAAVAILSGPEDKGGIKGWSQPLYNDVMAYAVSQGIPQQRAYSVTDPAAIRVMHKAMLFDKGQAAATAAAAQVTKAKVAPTKVAKPGGAPSPTSKGDALSRLRNTGSDDDATDAFMASLRA